MTTTIAENMTINSTLSLRKRFSKSTLAVFAVNGTGMVLLFVSQIVLARIIGVVEFGIYSYVLSWLGVLALAGKAGLDSALQRFIPEYAGKQQWGLCHGVLRRGYQISFLASLLLVALAWLLSPLILASLEQSYTVYILLMAALLPLSVLLRITQGALLAFKRPATSHLTESVLQSLVLIAGAVAVGVYASSAATSVTMLGIHLLAFTASLAAGIYLLARRVIPPQVATATAEYDTRHWMTVAFPLFVISSMYVLMSYTDTVMLGMLENTTVSGIYAATSRIALLVSLPLVFINSVLIPYISSLYHGDRFSDLQHIVTIATRTAGLLALPVFIVLALFGDIVLGLFGEEFTSGKTALNILIAGQLVNVLSGSVGALLMMTGQHHFAAKVVTLCATLNIVLNYLLIPEFGINGAAAATAITVVIWNAVFVASTRRRVGIKPTVFAGLNK